MTPHSSLPAFSQAQYQVRFDWGIEGADAVATDADVVIVVDVLPSSAAPSTPLDLGGHQGVVLAGSLRNAEAVAKWVLDQQDAKGDRLLIAVIAAGDIRPDGSARFALEDFLGAGSIIEELAELGIDYHSPEAAAAAAAFTGLRNATGHLISASATGRVLVEQGRKDVVALAVKRNVSADVPKYQPSREFDSPA